MIRQNTVTLSNSLGNTSITQGNEQNFIGSSMLPSLFIGVQGAVHLIRAQISIA
ncbi:MAG: hypothetical protein V5783_04365 [Pontiella sp.]